jgi:hypothetical protein
MAEAFKGVVPKAPEISIPRFNNGHWLFHKQMGDPEYIGFIYLVEDLEMDMFYLGRKNYRSKRGNKKGQELDWRRYRSSSTQLKPMWGERPLSDFKFICIDEYQTQSGLNYAETWSLCYLDVPLTTRFYNKSIEAITWNVREPITEANRDFVTELRRRVWNE